MTTNDNLDELYETKKELEKQLNKINKTLNKQIKEKKFTYHHLQKYNLLM